VKITVKNDDAGKRLDVFLAEGLSDLTRSRIQKLITEENIKVNEKAVRSNYKLRAQDEITVEIPDAKETELEAEEIPLDIVYEDDCMLVVNKPQGMVVHPAAGNYSGTLVNALMAHCGDRLSGINGEIRPGILHRIDKDTSGLLMVAKNDKAHLGLSQQIKEHSLTREYLALVHGRIKEDSGTIDAPIGRDEKDRLTVVYFKENILGFAFHLSRR